MLRRGTTKGAPNPQSAVLVHTHALAHTLHPQLLTLAPVSAPPFPSFCANPQHPPVLFPSQLLTLAPVSAPDHPLVLGNTHLFFHPRASHVRSIHAYVMADLIRRARDEAVAEGKCQERPAVVWVSGWSEWGQCCALRGPAAVWVREV